MGSWLILLLSTLAMTAIVGVRYLVVSGAFAWATKLREPGLYVGLHPYRPVGAQAFGIRADW